MVGFVQKADPFWKKETGPELDKCSLLPSHVAGNHRWDGKPPGTTLSAYKPASGPGSCFKTHMCVLVPYFPYPTEWGSFVLSLNFIPILILPLNSQLGLVFPFLHFCFITFHVAPYSFPLFQTTVMVSFNCWLQAWSKLDPFLKHFPGFFYCHWPLRTLLPPQKWTFCWLATSKTRVLWALQTPHKQWKPEPLWQSASPDWA